MYSIARSQTAHDHSEKRILCKFGATWQLEKKRSTAEQDAKQLATDSGLHKHTATKGPDDISFRL